jgi:hypothetical protein
MARRGLALVYPRIRARTENRAQRRIVSAEAATAREVVFHGYTKAVGVTLGTTRVVLCPQAGGRVLGRR